MEILRKARKALVAVLVICCNPEKGLCHMNRSTFDFIIFTLHRDVKFMHDRPEQMNVDSIFGLNFVEAHTTALLRHKNAVRLSEKNVRVLEETTKLCRRVRVSGKNALSLGAFEKMIRPEIWNHTILWRRGELGGQATISQGLTRAKATFIIYQGTPAEAESSRCLDELLRGSDTPECAVSKGCGEMLLRKDAPRGYPLAHRLLYVQTALALGCRERLEVPFAILKRNYCAAMLQDLIDLEATNFPPPSSDLAMEQILLCGMEGYLEFANSHYASLIASWPNSHGCYSALGFYGRNKSRRRRSTTLMDYGCDNHASGVAAASLSLLIRAGLENYEHDFHQ